MLHVITFDLNRYATTLVLDHSLWHQCSARDQCSYGRVTNYIVARSKQFSCFIPICIHRHIMPIAQVFPFPPPELHCSDSRRIFYSWPRTKSKNRTTQGPASKCKIDSCIIYDNETPACSFLYRCNLRRLQTHIMCQVITDYEWHVSSPNRFI